jgi:hypothetical protein
VQCKIAHSSTGMCRCLQRKTDESATHECAYLLRR